jgi:hypothetical protein
MSKSRSKLFPYSDRSLRTVRGFTTAIHFGRQAKHMPGHSNHDPAKSTITLPLPRLQELVESKGGTGIWRGSNKEVVDFGVPIGTYRVPGGGSPVSTSWGTIHYSKFGAHVVPARPRPSRGRSSG